MMVSPRLVLMLGVVTLCAASPSRFFSPAARARSNALDTVTVDCDNKEALEFVSKTYATFKCVYPNRNTQRASIVRNPNSAPLLFSNTVGQCPQGQVYDRAQRACISHGLQSASQVKEGTPFYSTTSCPPGTIYVPEVDTCLEAQKPHRTAPLQSGSLVFEEPKLELRAFSSDVQFASDCKPDEVYNSELSICMTVNPPQNRQPLSTLNLVKESPLPLEIQAFQESSDCKNGELFVPEIGACVSLSDPPLRSANQVRSVSYFDQKLDTAKDCSSGEVFVSEVGLCMEANPPKEKRPLVSDSQVQNLPSAQASPTPYKCKDNEVFVPEIGICQPARRPQTQNVPSSSSQVKEPVKLEIQSFQTSKDITNCPPGTIFVPEIGICVKP